MKQQILENAGTGHREQTWMRSCALTCLPLSKQHAPVQTDSARRGTEMLPVAYATSQAINAAARYLP